VLLQHQILIFSGPYSTFKRTLLLFRPLLLYRPKYLNMENFWNVHLWVNIPYKLKFLIFLAFIFQICFDIPCDLFIIFLKIIISHHIVSAAILNLIREGILNKFSLLLDTNLIDLQLAFLIEYPFFIENLDKNIIFDWFIEDLNLLNKNAFLFFVILDGPYLILSWHPWILVMVLNQCLEIKELTI